MNKLNEYFILVLIILHSCKPAPITTDLIEISTEKNPISFSNIFNIDEVINLETTDSCLINVIFKVELTDENIFILSNNQVYCFDRRGNYICKIGKLGNGPNEMIKPSDFDLSPNNEQLAIWDNIRRKLNIYNIDGRYQSSYSPNVRRVTNFNWHKNNIFQFDTEFEIQEDKSFCISEFNIKSGKIHQKINFSKEHQGYNILSYDAFPKINNTDCFLSTLTNSVYQFESEDYSRLIKIDFGSSEITKEMLTSFGGNTAKLISEVEKNNLSILMKFYQVDNCYITNYSKGRKIYSNIQSQNTQNQMTINHSNSFDLLSSLMPYGIYKNNLICVADPFKLLTNFKNNGKLVQNRNEADYNLVNELANKVKSDDNPLIFITSIKSSSDE
ncbi:6-bladed beta-propeller [Draconibacterium sp. IB214405]|uniref:6-bladed beta-propeller n=1 Tax=Draconibacterium sp. IB214405 TaxID=3097352 RepID=UPI002A174193|nr:6-bladed beta-propeller [Draconibacterium sp. IB214405]MDX8339747.1 6-bladed beta-propeller [Draconibacterium sp. IB214405]